MSLSRSHSDIDGIRDVRGDYIKAYLAEYDNCLQTGRQDHAKLVAAELRKLGHEVKVPVKEKAVPEPLEKAVEDDVPPKRRGRPAKAAE